MFNCLSTIKINNGGNIKLIVNADFGKRSFSKSAYNRHLILYLDSLARHWYKQLHYLVRHLT